MTPGTRALANQARGLWLRDASSILEALRLLTQIPPPCLVHASEVGTGSQGQEAGSQAGVRDQGPRQGAGRQKFRG